jgi:hypothetical protein
MRDNTGFKSDFSEFIHRRQQSTQRLNQAIISGEAAKERHQNIKEAILDNVLHSTIAQFSFGADKATITSSLLECITAFEEGFKWEGVEIGCGQYEEMLWPLCLGLLCDINNNDFKRITNIIKRDNVQDKLLDFIIHSKLKNEWPIASHNYIEPSPYKHTDTLNSIDEIKKYLDKTWYKGQRDAAWHNNHLNTKVNVYFGYWAWETAAIVKMKGFDDSSLKKQKYYPYDAVHW